MVYAHRHSGQAGNAELPGDLGSLVAQMMALALLLTVTPIGLGLLARVRFAPAFGISLGAGSAIFAVLAAFGGFLRLGSVGSLVVLHTFVAGVGIVALLAREVGAGLRGVGPAAVSLERSVNAATRPGARPLVWGLLGVAMVLEAIRTATDSRVNFLTIGVPRTVHAWVLHLVALSLVAIALFVIRKNKPQA